MQYKRYLLLAFIFVSLSLKAQNPANTNIKFRQFAHMQDSLLHVAYVKRDIKSYNTVLNRFLSSYQKLSKEDQQYFKGYDINFLYNLSCTYSLLNDKRMAIESLERSINAGYTNYNHIQEDTDLDNIRNEQGYKDIFEKLRRTSDYLYILKGATKYNPTENRELPKFTYQSRRDSNLISLRKSFKLDSIAGQGSEVSKILNLMHWVHNLIPHDGNHNNPAVKNALSTISVCKSEKRGLNCRGLATVLNECYLSIGIKSRFVTCLPKDSLKVDNDCHVINMVYSNELKKWLWIDPTNDAYVMNENGELLSIAEVRERIIADKPVILTPEANWNHKASIKKEDYLYNYMAKNLYLLECPLNSEYDAETRQQGKTINYLQLVPLDYFNKSLETSKIIDNDTKTSLNIYRTNNPDVFWTAP
ncbi:transglutaminase domain-containing protein [Pedobacter sp. HMF7647]|uniref:Transglutaminase domain-containing protein n=1 Tax=Hufsiella arboris TaxID=2695275 RepID=A0A7K1Y5Q8_9SPHI|nr:transglutaminase-like domain-containing protein [Hufsiella arboris]MXV49917.1 transglutaminase domain-containing protein [Hufsiella arboris]